MKTLKLWEIIRDRHKLVGKSFRMQGNTEVFSVTIHVVDRGYKMHDEHKPQVTIVFDRHDGSTHLLHLSAMVMDADWREVE